MSTVGSIMSTVGDIREPLGMFSTLGGYHDKCGDIVSTVGGIQYRGGTQILRLIPSQYSRYPPLHLS